MEEFKQEFINVAYSEFGIKAIESINFEQAFAILDKMQQLRIHDIVKQSEQLPQKPNYCINGSEPCTRKNECIWCR
jgi:hypothetical protein